MIAESFSKFVNGTSADIIPSDVLERAKYLMLDGVGVAYAASTVDFARPTLSALLSLGGGDSDVIGFSERLSLRDAVLMNGALVHGIDYDDTYTAGYLHPTACCLPTALGAAAALGRTGSDLLVAYILGMEIASRIAKVAKNGFIHAGFHPTGMVNAFAGAVIAGRLHELNPEALTMAQGIVLSMASGVREYATDGASSKRLHPGWGGVAGITAATLAKSGFTGPRAVYEGKFALYATHLGPAAKDYDYAVATHELGAQWEMMNVAVKPFPACQLDISCLDASIAIATNQPINPDEVARIEALVPEHAVKIVCEPVAAKRRPVNSYAAQFSIQFAVACALIHRKFGLAELELFQDPEILKLASKVDYVVDTTSGYPAHFNAGEVIVHMKDGSKFSHREKINRGAAEHPVRNDEIVAKYMQNAELVLPTAKAHQIREAILALDRAPSARVLSRVLAAQA